jgi:hypothetical protein
MRTIYLRNVPDDVVERLQKLAQQAGMSLNAFAVRELAAQSLRADNAALLDSLPDLSIDVDEVVAGVREDRDNR